MKRSNASRDGSLIINNDAFQLGHVGTGHWQREEEGLLLGLARPRLPTTPPPTFPFAFVALTSHHARRRRRAHSVGSQPPTHRQAQATAFSLLHLHRLLDLSSPPVPRSPPPGADYQPHAPCSRGPPRRRTNPPRRRTS